MTFHDFLKNGNKSDDRFKNSSSLSNELDCSIIVYYMIKRIKEYAIKKMVKKIKRKESLCLL